MKNDGKVKKCVESEEKCVKRMKRVKRVKKGVKRK